MLQVAWSRRIIEEHGIAYLVHDDEVVIFRLCYQ